MSFDPTELRSVVTPNTAQSEPNQMSARPAHPHRLRRRELLEGFGVMALAPSLLFAKSGSAIAAQPRKSGLYELPKLPYPTNALDGFLSAEILELHHARHHAGYVRGLNRALAEIDAARAKNDWARIKSLSRAVAFHGSGHTLHSLYWHSMSPEGGGAPEGPLRGAIDASFGSMTGFRQQFVAATNAAEASGWGILAYEPLGDRLLVLAVESHQQMGFQGSDSASRLRCLGARLLP